MDDIYKNIEEYNPSKEHKILIEFDEPKVLIKFDDMMADMLNNKNLIQ